MKQPPPSRRSLFERKHRYPSNWLPPGKVVTIVFGLPLFGLIVTMLSNAPGLAAMLAVFAGIATAPVIVPYLVVRAVTATLERQRTRPERSANRSATWLKRRSSNQRPRYPQCGTGIFGSIESTDVVGMVEIVNILGCPHAIAVRILQHQHDRSGNEDVPGLVL